MAMSVEKEREGCWAKTLLAPVDPVPLRVRRAHALKNCIDVVKATEHFVRTDLTSKGPERAARLKRAAADLQARSDDEVCDLPTWHGEASEVDAEELLRRVCDRARDCAEARDIDLIVRCTWRRVVVCPDAFSEALFNLLVNSIDATRPGYPVLAVVSGTADGDVLWEIQDAGEGMSPDVLAWIGEPFRTTRLHGAGLGVALARAIIEDHGGMLRFESALGIGTTASAWMPRSTR